MNKPVKLTEHQRLVFDALEQAKSPQSAYALLDAVSDQGIKAPVQIYRALDKLVAAGMVHKVESLNAFIACHDRHERHWAAFTICEACGAVGEVVLTDPEALEALGSDVEGFEVHSAQVELRGLCAACSAAATS
jgi:Fur family zinc uptake transcriptional regulator